MTNMKKSSKVKDAITQLKNWPAMCYLCSKQFHESKFMNLLKTESTLAI